MGEATVSVKDLLVRILRHWRAFIVCMLVGAFVFDAAAFIKQKQDTAKYYAMQNGETDQEEKQEVDKLQLAEFKEKLTDIQVAQVEKAVSIYKIYQKSYDDTINYINNSIKMQLDPNQICTNVIQYQIDVGYSVQYPVIDRRDPTQNIKDSIYYKLVNDANCTEIAKALGENIGSSYIKELISAPATGTTGVYPDDIYTLSVMGRSYDECDKITTILKREIVKVFDELKKQYGNFKVTDMGVQKFKSYNQGVLDAQKNQANSLRDVRVNSVGIVDALSADQKTYFYALLNGDDTVEISLPVDTKEAETSVVSEPPRAHKINPKMIVIGAMAGFLLAFLLFLCKLLINGKLISDRTMKDAFGLEQLGSVRVSQEPSGIGAGIDKALLNIMDGGMSAYSNEERLRMAVAGIRIALQKNNWKNIFLTSTSTDEETRGILDQLRQQLAEDAEGIKIGKSVVYDPESLQQMAQSEAVVLAERTDYSRLEEIDREYSLCHQNQVPVLGYVIVK